MDSSEACVLGTNGSRKRDCTSPWVAGVDGEKLDCSNDGMLRGRHWSWLCE